MEDRKFYTCCFTGHRPNKLPWGEDENCDSFFRLKNHLEKEIKNKILKGYKNFICGMALGVDLLCAEIIVNLKKTNKDLNLECAIPCYNQTEKWNPKQIERYEKILINANKITYVSKCGYFNGCMQKRNKYMVDNSNSMIAVFNGEKGGTRQTIEYAKKQKLDIIIIQI